MSNISVSDQRSEQFFQPLYITQNVYGQAGCPQVG